MPEQAKCRSCGADILWCRTEGGHLTPVNAEPDDTGNMVILDGIAKVVKDSLFEPMTEGTRYKSHFATCPAAAKHRKR